MNETSMSVLQAVFLGFVQGLTEFLPVSSSGHLLLFQKLMLIPSDPLLFFDTLLHCGTLAAVIVALRHDVWNLIRRPFQRVTIYIIVATAVTAAIALFFREQFEEAFKTGRWLGQAFLVTSAALFISEYVSRRPGGFRNDAEMGWFDAIFIGALQGIAIAPGVSRSGLTLAGALSRKLNRDLAVRFSFLLSIPAILGALVFQIKELYDISKQPSTDPLASKKIIIGITSGPLIAGTITSAVVGFAAVVLMLRIVRKNSLTGFAVYTGILGLLILLNQYLFHVVVF
jgi:undecaprenyl-diphosphatase